MSGRSVERVDGELLAVGALAFILACTFAWWGLALWPVAETAPAWLERTRLVCFGVGGSGLPDKEGWIALILQPALMLGILATAWGRSVGSGLARLARARTGQFVIAVTALTVLGGAAMAAARVQGALAQEAESRDPEPTRVVVTAVGKPAPELGLVDQFGDTISVSDLRGAPALLTFAFGHCETVCPLVVHEALTAQRQLGDLSPALIVISLDPWRDTPSRLSHIAESWGMGSGARFLSGSVPGVNSVLDAWGIQRTRDLRSGEITHPALVYVLDSSGVIAYMTNGGADRLVELVRGLRRE